MQPSERLPATSGELVFMRPDGTTCFNGLQDGLRFGGTAFASSRSIDCTSMAMIFGQRPSPVGRHCWRLCWRVLVDSAPIRYAEHLDAAHGPPALFDQARSIGLKGVVSKLRTGHAAAGTPRPGSRRSATGGTPS